MILGLLAAVASMISTPAGIIDNYVRPPAMDISAVRQIACDGWTGSGFIIAKGIMATANHVMEGGEHCIDVESEAPLTTYKVDKAHDLALVTGDFPTDIPYVKYSCEPFHAGQAYLAYGITGYMQNHEIIRNNVIVATGGKTGKDFKFVDDFPVINARIFIGYEAPGMSGGPVTDLNGYAHGLVTGGNNNMSMHYEFADGILCKP